MVQYKVYASLSRLGYKVFKHKGPNTSNKNNSPSIDNVDSPSLKTINEGDLTDSPASTKINEPNIDSPSTQDSQTTENNETIKSIEKNESPGTCKGSKEENNAANDLSNETPANMDVDENMSNVDSVARNDIQETSRGVESDINLVGVTVDNVVNPVESNVKSEEMDVSINSQDKADSGKNHIYVHNYFKIF